MNIRLRKDLNHTKRQQGLETVWVLKDPVAFTHFQFSEAEYFLAKLFNGDRSVDQVVDAWRRKFKSASLSLEQVNSFAQRLISDQLVTVEKPGYGRLLSRLDDQQVSKQRRWPANWMVNPLAIRFRGINPNPILKQFDWLGRIMFHPAVIVLVLITSALVLLFLLGNFELIAERTPRIEQILSTQGVLGLLTTVAIVKVLHELGHALACRRFGADCLEIGVMFLALIPTLYCNVSDAWTIPDRWKRMMVSFAGMYVEICLAAIAAIAWCLTPPGLLSALLFNVVILCSLNTLLVNGNPLLRYDGYYLLSDWLEKPNLSQAASSELNKFASLAIRKPNQGSGHIAKNSRSVLSEFNWWLLFYSIAAFCYRWFVVGIIVYAMVCFASVWQARSLGLILGAGLVLSMVFRSKGSSMLSSGATSPISKVRVALTLAVMATLLAFVIFIPLPKSVSGNFEVRLEDPVPVFSPTDGKLISVVEPYQHVAQGQMVARLENPELSQKVALKRLELSRARNELEMLNARINHAPSIASKISVARKNVAAVEAAFVIYEEELKRMDVVAPQAGVVFPSIESESSSDNVSDHAVGQSIVPSGSGLMDTRNENCFVRSSQHLLTIANPDVRELLMFVSEKDMDYVAVGQSVRLLLDRFPGQSFVGKVGEIYTEPTPQGDQVEPTETLKRFPVSVAIQEFPGQAVAGAVGRAKISVPSQSIGKRLWLLFERAKNTKL